MRLQILKLAAPYAQCLEISNFLKPSSFRSSQSPCPIQGQIVGGLLMTSGVGHLKSAPHGLSWISSVDIRGTGRPRAALYLTAMVNTSQKQTGPRRLRGVVKSTTQTPNIRVRIADQRDVCAAPLIQKTRSDITVRQATSHHTCRAEQTQIRTHPMGSPSFADGCTWDMTVLYSAILDTCSHEFWHINRRNSRTWSYNCSTWMPLMRNPTQKF